MEQLILHLIGDYGTQSQWMSDNKVKATWPALCHATVYSLPFFLIGSPMAVFVIWITHFLIDRFRIAKYLVYAKNQFFSPAMSDLLLGERYFGSKLEMEEQDALAPQFDKWEDCSATGYHKNLPPFLALWLMIALDNTLHLTINYLALKHL